MAGQCAIKAEGGGEGKKVDESGQYMPKADDIPTQAEMQKRDRKEREKGKGEAEREREDSSRIVSSFLNKRRFKPNALPLSSHRWRQR